MTTGKWNKIGGPQKELHWWFDDDCFKFAHHSFIHKQINCCFHEVSSLLSLSQSSIALTIKRCFCRMLLIFFLWVVCLLRRNPLVLSILNVERFTIGKYLIWVNFFQWANHHNNLLTWLWRRPLLRRRLSRNAWETFMFVEKKSCCLFLAILFLTHT